MKQGVNRNLRIWLVLATVVLVAVLAALWATTYSPDRSIIDLRPQLEPRRRLWPLPGRIELLDIEVYYTAKTVISSINVTLLISLLIMYIGMYRKTQSEFTIGLIVFSLILLFNALVSNPLMHWFFGFRAFGLGPFAMLPDLFTCVALAVLLYLTVKY